MNFRTLVLALAVVSACKKEPPPVAPPTAPAPAEPAEMDLSTAVTSKTTEVYDVSITAPEVSAQNEQVEATLTVQAKGGMHINAEYPINFRPVRTVNSVKFGREKFDLVKEARRTPCEGKGRDDCALTAPIPFTIDAPGPRRVEGILAFSVCDKNRCLIEKATLGMDVKGQ
jgi:hypothetical protein